VVDEIRAKVLGVPSLLSQRDISGILKLYAVEDRRFTAFEDHPPYSRIDGNQFRVFLEDMLSSVEEIKVDRQDIRVDLLDETAVVTGVDKWRVKMGGELLQGMSRFTLVFHKINNEWKIIHEHFSLIPSMGE